MSKLFDKQLNKYQLGLVCTVALGLIFLFSGIGKLVKPPGIELFWFLSFVPPIPEWVPSPVTSILASVEIAAGLALLVTWIIKLDAQLSPAIYLSLFLLLNFIINNLWLIIVKKQLYTCGQCLGWGINTWPGASLFLDILMLGMAVTAITYFRGYKKEVACGTV